MSDALVALGRICKFLTAEELVNTLSITHNAVNGVEAEGTFIWETRAQVIVDNPCPVFSFYPLSAADPSLKEHKPAETPSTQHHKRKWDFLKRRKVEQDSEVPLLPTRMLAEKAGRHSPAEDEKPFELVDLVLRIPKGSFVAIVGRVGSGKVLPMVVCQMDDISNVS